MSEATDFQTILKATDWYFEYAEGATYSKGKASYEKAIAALKTLDPEEREQVIDIYVPGNLRKDVLRDIYLSGAV